MSKIYRRSTLIKNTKSKKDKNRKRSVIMNFRVSPEEKELIDKRIELSGLGRADYFIESCMYQKLLVKGNIKTFDAIRKTVKDIDDKLIGLVSVDELDGRTLESLRMVLEILDRVFASEGK